MKLERKNTGKKLNEIYIIALIVTETVTCSALFTSGRAVHLTWYI